MLPAQTHPVDYMSIVRHTHSNILLSKLDNVRIDTKEAFCEQHKLRCGYLIVPNGFANDELGSALTVSISCVPGVNAALESVVQKREVFFLG